MPEGRWLQLSVDLAFAEVAERKLTVEEEEAKRIAEMGKPILGEHPKLEVIIEESYEFKVSGWPRGSSRRGQLCGREEQPWRAGLRRQRVAMCTGKRLLEEEEECAMQWSGCSCW